MAFGWPSRAHGDQFSDGEVVNTLGIAPLPGSDRVYSSLAKEWKSRNETVQVPLIGTSGRLVSVIKGTRRKDAALRTMSLLCGKEMSPKICASDSNGTFFRASQAARIGTWIAPFYSSEVGTEYATTVIDQNEIGLCLESMQVPGFQEYFAVTNQVVVDVCENGADVQTSLSEAAKRWDEITDRLGRKDQLVFYRKNLGLVE